MVQRKSNSGKTFWKWRARSTKSASESDPRDMSFASPTNSLSAPAILSKSLESSQLRTLPLSPFASESAHVLSLQRPSDNRVSDQFHNASDISPSTTRANSVSTVSTAFAIPDATPHDSTPSCTSGLYVRAKQSIESRLSSRMRKQVGDERSKGFSICTNRLRGAFSPQYLNTIALLGRWMEPEATAPSII